MVTKEIELEIKDLDESSKTGIEKKFESILSIKSISWNEDNTKVHIRYDSDVLSAEDVRKLIQNENCLCELSKKAKMNLRNSNPDKRILGKDFRKLNQNLSINSVSCCSTRDRFISMTKNVPVDDLNDKKHTGQKMDKMLHEEMIHKKPIESHKHHEMIEERPSEAIIKPHEHDMHHETKSRWQRFKMNMSMTMDMDHGSGGISMLKMMEDSIKFRFIFSLFFTIPIVLYSDLGRNVLGINLPIPFNLSLAFLLFLLASPVVIYGGWMFIYGAYNSLKKRKLDMSVLIAVGISAAYIFSILINLIDPEAESFYEASAMLVSFVLFGHWMEMRARRGTSDSMRALFELVPPQARILINGEEKLIATAEVKVNDILIIKPGDKVPVDGIVTEGSTSIDESLVTGESIPVEKSINDKVIGGSINLSGTIKVKTFKVGSDTALGQIMDLVQKAQTSKAPGQRIADKFAGYLVIVAVSVGLITFLIWYILVGNLIRSLTFAISAVVIACPDALGLATPTAVAVGTGLGAQHNVLIKDASTLEEVSNVNVVMFDKTGTLTVGKPVITDFFTGKDFDLNLSIQYMQALEAKSNHPLSLAIMNFAKENNSESDIDVKAFKNVSGKGIEGRIDEKSIFIGNLKAINEMHYDLSDLQEKILKLSTDGKTLLIMAVDKRVVSVAAAEDQIKMNSKYTVDYLHQMGVKVGMISGDNEITARKVADTLGIDIVFAEVLPSEKADHIKSLQNKGYKVAMVGDGVNDAPALAQADIGIAIGAGTDVAIETAKIILMKSDPLDVVTAILLSKSTVTKMKQNLAWASIYNILAIPIAAGILYPFTNILLSPAFAALLMSLSSIFVATNAILLKKVESKIVRLKQLKPFAI